MGEEVKKADVIPLSVPSQLLGSGNIVFPTNTLPGSAPKVEGTTEKEKGFDLAKVDDLSLAEDEWSVVSNEKDQGKNEQDGFLSPVLLAKWDTELHQLHELGFLDDRKNVNVLEALEASHVGVDSSE